MTLKKKLIDMLLKADSVVLSTDTDILELDGDDLCELFRIVSEYKNDNVVDETIDRR